MYVCVCMLLRSPWLTEPLLREPARIRTPSLMAGRPMWIWHTWEQNQGSCNQVRNVPPTHSPPPILRTPPQLLNRMNPCFRRHCRCLVKLNHGWLFYQDIKWALSPALAGLEMYLCAKVDLGGLDSLYPPRLRLDSSVSGMTYSQSTLLFSSFSPLVDHSHVDFVGQMCHLRLVILPYILLSLLLPPVALCSERAIPLEHWPKRSLGAGGGVWMVKL